jgi:hypothetical protein
MWSLTQCPLNDLLQVVPSHGNGICTVFAVEYSNFISCFFYKGVSVFTIKLHTVSNGNDD